MNEQQLIAIRQWSESNLQHLANTVTNMKHLNNSHDIDKKVKEGVLSSAKAVSSGFSYLKERARKMDKRSHPIFVLKDGTRIYR